MSDFFEIEKLSDKEWSELASYLSGENTDNPEMQRRIIDSGRPEIETEWKEMGMITNSKGINVNRAWDNLYSRIKEDKNAGSISMARSSAGKVFLRIAAMAFLLIAVGSALLYLNKKSAFTQKTTFSTGPDQNNLQVKLSDGSIVFLNYNSVFSYSKNFGVRDRNVTLKGEAFFEIKSDNKKPFTIDAEKARVKVTGTSFNVITDNADHEVEVFVKSGIVTLSDFTGSRNIVLEPGYVGKINSKQATKTINKNQNYLSWNTGRIVYEGENLETVFNDLNRIFNIAITASDSAILNEPITGNWDNSSHETIIRLICTTFNLSYKKDGNVYHLEKNNR
jgi:ferric-dicitrate binding protein FerR (iron transport regulator)